MSEHDSRDQARRVGEALAAPFPSHAILARQGAGGRTFRYLAAHTVIRRLNDATGCRWDFRLTRMDLHGDLWIAAGELTIPGLGTRVGIGVQKVTAGGGEDLVKGAASDALKKAAVSFGVGIGLYGPDLEAGEVDGPAEAPRRTGGNGPPRNYADDIARAGSVGALRELGTTIQRAGVDDERLRAAYRARMVALRRATAPDLPDDGRPPEDGPRPGGVTKPQMGKIWAVAREKLGDAADEALHAMASETHELGLTPTLWDLTRADASELIEYLSHTDEQTLRADLGPVVFDWRQKRDGNGSGDGDGPPDASTPTVATEDVGHEAAFAAVMDGMPEAEAPARDWGA